MKNSVAIVYLLFAFACPSVAQIISGEFSGSGINYVDIDDDSLILATNSSSFLIYDLDNDGTNDLKFMVSNSSGMGGYSNSSRVYTLHNNIEVAAIPPSMTLADTMQFGSTIDNNRAWHTTQSSFFHLRSDGFTAPSTSYAYGTFVRTDNYLGFRILGANDVKYGWFLISTFGSAYQQIFKSYAYRTTSVGFDQNMNGSLPFKVYPNPATDKLNIITNSPTSEITLFDLYGKEHHPAINDNHEIDVSTLESGIYFLKITTPSGFTTNKVIVQH